MLNASPEKRTLLHFSPSWHTRNRNLRRESHIYKCCLNRVLLTIVDTIRYNTIRNHVNMALGGRVIGLQGYCSCKQPGNENKSTGLNVHPYRIRPSLRCSVFIYPLSLHTWGISILQLSQPALRYWNRCKYRIADTACFSFFGTVLCGIVFALV